jgi:hypothetical protein
LHWWKFENFVKRKIMLEIIALIFLCKKNGVLAEKKGLKPGTWKLYTVIAWIVTEFFGIFIGMMMFGKTNLVAVFATGIFGAFGGYLFIRYNLENRPDNLEEDVNHIGVDDLQPPPR